MNRAIVQMLEGKYVNLLADRIEIRGEWLTVWHGEAMVGVFDIGQVLSAYISEKRKTDERN